MHTHDKLITFFLFSGEKCNRSNYGSWNDSPNGLPAGEYKELQEDGRKLNIDLKTTTALLHH